MKHIYTIKHIFTQFFWKLFSFLFLVLSICFVKEIYFSLVIGSISIYPSYAVAISLIIKCALPKKWLKYIINFYNLNYSLNALDHGIYWWDGNDRVPMDRPEWTISRRCNNASRYGMPLIVLSSISIVSGYFLHDALSLELSHEPRYIVFIATELIRQ